MQALYFEWDKLHQREMNGDVLPILDEIYAWEDWIKTRFAMMVEDLPVLAEAAND